MFVIFEFRHAWCFYGKSLKIIHMFLSDIQRIHVILRVLIWKERKMRWLLFFGKRETWERAKEKREKKVNKGERSPMILSFVSMCAPLVDGHVVLSHIKKHDPSWSASHARGKKMFSNRVTTKIYLFQWRKGKILIKPLKEKENGRHNWIQVRESVMQGEHISIPQIRCTQI